MKRVKVMLMSLLVLSVVGGALAFKAKFEESFCTTTPRTSANGNLVCINAAGGALKCPTTITNRQFTDGAGTIYCTAPVPVGGCNADINCVAITKLTTDK